MNPNYCNAGVVWPPKVPKDGWGPRGVPDCYYTSRVLNSTGHYVRFVKKLRITEEEDRIARLDLKKKNEDQQCIDFFQKCDRKNYITRIANRVDICFKAYEKELQERREKLKNMLCEEEKKNMWLFTKKAQSVSDVIWQGKMENLARLLAKRKKEVEARVSDPPLSKCAHVLPCIVKLRAKEAEEIQLYQIREKQLRKEAEREMDKMWYEVTMKESDALAARMDYMAIDRLRRDKECTEQTLKQIEMNKMKRANEQEMLKQQVLRMKADFEEGERKEREAQEKRRMNVLKQKEEITNDILKRKELMAEQQAKEKIISGTWESLAEQSLPGDRAKEEARRQKRRELDECNAKMVAMKNRIADIRYDNDPMILEEGRRLLDAYELKRCQHDAFMKKRFVDTQNVNKGVVEKDEQEASRKAEERRREEEYNQELTAQLNQLVRNKQLTDAQARKLHQKDLVKQSEYNKLLKDRARQEALEQDKKYKIARGQYQEQIEKMLSRPFFSDAINPFMKQMASEIRMRDMCPCGAPDYCLNPIHEKPKTLTEK